MNIRFVAAVPEELEGPDGALDGRALGVGILAAGLAAARLLAGERPDAIVLLGTAGAYPGGPPIGAVVAARRVGFCSGTATLGLGYVPRAPGPLDTDAALRAHLALPEADVATLVAITTDAGLASRLAAGWQVEHMEAYGVAAACAAVGVPFAAVFGITNVVGPDAHAQWCTNRVECQRAAVAAVARLSGER